MTPSRVVAVVVGEDEDDVPGPLLRASRARCRQRECQSGKRDRLPQRWHGLTPSIERRGVDDTTGVESSIDGLLFWRHAKAEAGTQVTVDGYVAGPEG